MTAGPAPRLVLFDVDGTLLITGGATSRCILRACRKLFGESFEWGPITVGTLDHQIYAQLARHNGVDRPEARHAEYKRTYLAELEADLRATADHVRVMPGVHELLTALDERRRGRGDVVVGLLTGNYRRAVELKLEAAGLDPATFAVGAFAEDGAVRADLIHAAVQQATEQTGRPVEARHTVVVGDTPRDVECARAHGCASLAVATGRYSAEELSRCGPTAVVETLADAAPLWRLLDGRAGGDAAATDGD